MILSTALFLNKVTQGFRHLAQHPLFCISDVFENQINRLFCLKIHNNVARPHQGRCRLFQEYQYASLSNLPARSVRNPLRENVTRGLWGH